MGAFGARIKVHGIYIHYPFPAGLAQRLLVKSIFSTVEEGTPGGIPRYYVGSGRVMSAGKLVRGVFLGAVKLSVLTGLVYLVCGATLKTSEARSSPAKDICGRVKPGMTIQQIDTATTTFEGWQVLRDDGVMVISAHSYREKSPVCRVTIDPTTHGVSSVSIGPIQQGDWPTL
jgi:hypothetical protein